MPLEIYLENKTKRTVILRVEANNSVTYCTPSGINRNMLVLIISNHARREEKGVSPVGRDERRRKESGIGRYPNYSFETGNSATCCCLESNTARLVFRFNTKDLCLMMSLNTIANKDFSEIHNEI